MSEEAMTLIIDKIKFLYDIIVSDTSTKNPTLQCVNTASFSLRMFCLVFKSTKKIKQTTNN